MSRRKPTPAAVRHRFDERAEKAIEAMQRGDHIAAGWWLYGVGPRGTRPKDCK